jgi:hypothetical protein
MVSEHGVRRKDMYNAWIEPKVGKKGYESSGRDTHLQRQEEQDGDR